VSDRQYVDKVTVENWRTSVTSRAHAGMWMGAHIEEDDSGFVGVWGIPAKWGYTVRCDTLEDALSWVNREPQPFRGDRDPVAGRRGGGRAGCLSSIGRPRSSGRGASGRPRRAVPPDHHPTTHPCSDATTDGESNSPALEDA
jgi:hypothetical protein